jgi:SAM-dependent methyltransferase
MTENAPPPFSERMAAILNGGALTVAVAIGYRTGLFDAMAGMAAPAPASAVAAAAGLSERYVREWLGIMGTGGVVDMEKDGGGETLFRLPPDRAACLTRDAGTGNLAVYAQEIPLLTVTAMEKVVAAFRTGEGVPYRDYPAFQSFMAELSNAKHRDTLVDTFLPSVEGGLMVRRLRAGIRVCDLGCGEGVAVLLMARSFPESRFTGIDLDAGALERAREAARREGIANAVFEAADAARLSESPRHRGAFDYVTAFDAVHDQTAPLEALRGVRAMLAPGGRFSMVDIAAHSDPVRNAAHPMAPFLYTVSLLHCMPVGLMDRGAGLGMMWGREAALELLAAAGFEEVAVAAIPDDPFNLHFFCKAP